MKTPSLIKKGCLCLGLVIGANASLADGIWSPLGSGLNSSVNALSLVNGTLYAGGYFTNAGGAPAARIAQWNGTSWSAVGPGLNLVEYALLATNGLIYAGGSTTSNLTACFEEWNGTNWLNLGSNLSGGSLELTSVGALAMLGTNLIVGGQFSSVTNHSAHNIAAWNGRTWSPLGYYPPFWGGVEPQETGEYYLYPPVQALAVSGTSLYVGGNFDVAGNVYSANPMAANNVAKWDGTNWSALGNGVNNYVWALAASGKDLYVGGSFTQAGGIAASSIAKWDGTNWSALGSGLSGGTPSQSIFGEPPYAGCLAVAGGMLYVGGGFTMAGGVTVNNIARWDGTNWSAIGSGVNGFVNGIAVSGNTLYAGGFFTSAGGSAANYAAMANLAPLTILTGNAAFGFASGYFGFDVTGPSGSNAVIQGSADLRTWVPLQTNQLSNGMFHFSDTQYPGNSQWFYRVQLGP